MSFDAFPPGMRRWIVASADGILWVGAEVQEEWQGADPGKERAEEARLRLAAAGSAEPVVAIGESLKQGTD